MNTKIVLFLVTMFATMFRLNASADYLPPNEKLASKPSGLWGYTIVTGLPPDPETPLMADLPNCDVIIKSAKTQKIIKTVRSNDDGRYSVTLPPGKYLLIPKLPNIVTAWAVVEKTAIVRYGTMYEATVKYDAGW